jgi:aryl-alcohol dehydrogenase-like predicted oxidoreductase
VAPPRGTDGVAALEHDGADAVVAQRARRSQARRSRADDDDVVSFHRAENKVKAMTATAQAAGTFTLGGDMEVNRMGFGAMRITGRGIWGPPDDPEECKRVLRRCIELDVNLIDTADSYGPEVSENLIAEALHPYPDNLVIATKAGMKRPGPGEWERDLRPERIKDCCEASLRRLRVDQIDLYQLHAVDPKVPYEDSVGAVADLQSEGKVRHIGVCNVGRDDLDVARGIVDVVSVQNRYSLSDRGSQDVLDACEADGIAFLPYFPLAAGRLARPGGKLDQVAQAHRATTGQLALAWLLQSSPNTIPIPGTSSGTHLEENYAAATLELSDEEMAALDEAGRAG